VMPGSCARVTGDHQHATASARGRRGRPAAGRKRSPTAVGAGLIVASAIAFALDGPVARAAYQQGLDPATFGFWRASAGVVVLGG
jgi:hypothetical protein